MTEPAEGQPTGAISWAQAPPEGLEVPDAAVVRAVQAALEHGEQPGRVVDVVFVDKQTLASMHGDFLGDPSETDVITFDLRADGDPLPGAADGPPMEADGELYISVDRAHESSEDRGVSFERELILYVVHGVLHLCGMEDHEPEQRLAMRAAEGAVLGQLGYPVDPIPHDD